MRGGEEPAASVLNGFPGLVGHSYIPFPFGIDRPPRPMP